MHPSHTFDLRNSDAGDPFNSPIGTTLEFEELRLLICILLEICEAYDLWKTV